MFVTTFELTVNSCQTCETIPSLHTRYRPSVHAVHHSIQWSCLSLMCLDVTTGAPARNHMPQPGHLAKCNRVCEQALRRTHAITPQLKRAPHGNPTAPPHGTDKASKRGIGPRLPCLSVRRPSVAGTACTHSRHMDRVYPGDTRWTGARIPHMRYPRLV